MQPQQDVTLSFAEGETFIPVTTEEGSVRETLQLLRIGDIAFVGTPGELYSSIGKYMREHSPLPYTMVVDNTWNWPDSDTGYIEDDEGVRDPGFGNQHHFVIGKIAPSFSDLANRLIRETER